MIDPVAGEEFPPRQMPGPSDLTPTSRGGRKLGAQISDHRLHGHAIGGELRRSQIHPGLKNRH